MYISHAKRGPRRKAGQAPGRPARYAIAQALLVGLLATSLHNAHAQGSEYHIAAQPLDSTLSQIAERHGLQLLAPANLTQGLQAAPVQGRLTLEQAIARALAGSGLTATRSGNTLVVQRHNTEANRPVSHALPEVAVTAATEVPFTNATTNNFISREQIERIPPTNVGDLFQDMPGVTSANNRTGASFDLNVRGIQGMGRVKIVVDGTQMSSTHSRGYGGDQTHAYVDPELLSSVVVEKGPNSGPYGAGATGGVVSMTTIGAKDLLRDGKPLGLRVRGGLAGNSNGTGNLGGVDPAGQSLPGHGHTFSAAGAWRANDNLDLVLGLSTRSSGNYQSGKKGSVTFDAHDDGFGNLMNWDVSPFELGAEVNNTSQKTDSGLFKASLRLPHQQTLDLAYTRLKTEFGSPRVTYDKNYTTQLLLSDSDKQTYGVRYAWTPEGNPWIDLRANIWAAQADEYRSNQQSSTSANEIRFVPQDSDSRSRGVEVWNTSVFSWDWLPELSLKYGATWLQEKVNVIETGTRYESSGTRNSSSMFLQAEANPAPWLSLNAGLRRDSYGLKGTAAYASTIPGQSEHYDRINHGGNRINPSLGATFTPWGPDTRLFARYSEGWRPGSVKEVFGSYSSSTGRNPLLTPEISKTLEMGAEQDWRQLLVANDRAAARLAVFSTDYDNFMMGTLGSYQNIDKARYRGLEFSLDYDARWLFARYTLTYFNSVQVCDGMYFRQTGSHCVDYTPYAGGGEFNGLTTIAGVNPPPKHKQTLTLGTRLLERRLLLAMRVTDVGRATLPSVRQTGERSSIQGWLPYSTIDLFGSYQFNRDFGLNFSVENLRDRYYLESNTHIMSAMPAPGRTFKLALTYQY